MAGLHRPAKELQACTEALWPKVGTAAVCCAMAQVERLRPPIADSWAKMKGVYTTSKGAYERRKSVQSVTWHGVEFVDVIDANVLKVDIEGAYHEF